MDNSLQIVNLLSENLYDKLAIRWEEDDEADDVDRGVTDNPANREF